MRFIWALVILIAIVLAVAIFWPAALMMPSGVPPGQYPINRKRPSWPSTEVVRPYRPMNSEEPPSFVHDAKVRCATSKACPSSLATVSLDV